MSISVKKLGNSFEYLNLPIGCDYLFIPELMNIQNVKRRICEIGMSVEFADEFLEDIIKTNMS